MCILEHPFMENEGDKEEDSRMWKAGESGDGNRKVSFIPLFLSSFIFNTVDLL